MGNQQERLKLRTAWLAGIIEGEGWISLCKVMVQQKKEKKTQSYTPNIGVCNSDVIIMNEVENILCEYGIRYRKQTRDRSKEKSGFGSGVRKNIYELSIATHDNVIKIIDILYPYFIGAKKHKLESLKEYILLRKSRPKSGINSKHGVDEKKIYDRMYSYKGKSQFKNPQRLHAKSLVTSQAMI